MASTSDLRTVDGRGRTDSVERGAGRKQAVPRRRPAWRWETHPTLGLVSVVLGTLAAVLLTPADVGEAGQLRVPSLMLALSLIVVPLRVVLRSPASLFHPVTLVAASPVYWLLLDPIQGAYDMASVSADEVRLSFLAIGLFSSCVWAAGHARPARLPQVVKDAATIRLGPRALFGLGVAAFVLAFLRFAVPSGFDIPAMLGAFGKNRWAAPWARGALGGWDAFLDHLGYFGYLLPPLTAFLARRAGWGHWRTVVLAACSFVLLALFSTGGGRRIIGVMVGSGLVVYFLSARPPRLKDLLVMGAACAVLLAFLQTMLIYRSTGIAEAFTKDTQVESRMDHLHVDDNFLRLAEVIHIVPEHHAHAGSQWLLWVAVRPVPRLFWPGKPKDPGFNLAGYHGMKGTSLTMSLVGELYMAFGFLGCAAGGGVVGFLANALSRVMSAGARPGALMVLGSGLLALFAGMRSGIDLVLMSYGMLAWIGLVWMLRRTRT